MFEINPALVKVCDRACRTPCIGLIANGNIKLYWLCSLLHFALFFKKAYKRKKLFYGKFQN